MTAAATSAEVAEMLDRHVRRFIRGHAGDVTVEDVSAEGDVRLRFHGACRACPLLNTTFAMSVYPIVTSIEGVREVSADGVTLTDRALRRVAAITDGSDGLQAHQDAEKRRSDRT